MRRCSHLPLKRRSHFPYSPTLTPYKATQIKNFKFAKHNKNHATPCSLFVDSFYTNSSRKNSVWVCLKTTCLVKQDTQHFASSCKSFSTPSLCCVPVLLFRRCSRTITKLLFREKNRVLRNATKRGLHTIRHRPQFLWMCVAVFANVYSSWKYGEKSSLNSSKTAYPAKVFHEMLASLTNHSLHTIRILHKFFPFVPLSSLFANSV